MDCDICYWFFENHCYAPLDLGVGCSCSLYEKDIFGNLVLNVHGPLWK